MKKLFFFVAALALAMSSMAATHHLYIDNQTGWEATALYAWADGRPDVLGGWPGIQAAGTVEKDGVTYLDFQVDATAFPANFIFNNNGGGTQLGDLYLEAGDYYLVADATSLREAGTNPEPPIVESGTRTIYLDVNVWSSDNPIFAAWVWNTGDADAAGYHFTLVEGTIYKADIRDDATNIIFLRKDPAAEGATTGIWEGEWNRAQTGIPADQNLFTITAWEEPWGTWSTYGTGEVQEKDNYNLYVNNQTGWAAFHLYAWGDSEVFGTWPGMVATETVVKDGVTYLVYPFTAAKGSAVATYHLIFHNNIGEGVEGDMRQLFDITEARDYYLTVKSDAVLEENYTDVESVVAPQNEAKKVIRNGQMMIVRDGRVFNILGAEL